MKLSQLILQREALLRQARLSNLAYVYSQLSELVDRIDRSRLRGLVSLQPADSAVDRPWPVLTALEGSQSVIEEHFTDENIVDLASLIAFLAGGNVAEITFQLEDMAAQFLAPIKRELEKAGVDLEPDQSSSIESTDLGPDLVER